MKSVLIKRIEKCITKTEKCITKTEMYYLNVLQNCITKM